MIHASAIAESIVAPTLFRPEFSHSLSHKRTFHNKKIRIDGSPIDGQGRGHIHPWCRTRPTRSGLFFFPPRTEQVHPALPVAE